MGIKKGGGNEDKGGLEIENCLLLPSHTFTLKPSLVKINREANMEEDVIFTLLPLDFTIPHPQALEWRREDLRRKCSKLRAKEQLVCVTGRIIRNLSLDDADDSRYLIWDQANSSQRSMAGYSHDEYWRNGRRHSAKSAGQVYKDVTGKLKPFLFD